MKGDSGTNYFWHGRETEYDVSIQGQADLIHDMIEAVAKVKNNMGLGTLYWGGENLPSENVPTAWENQALFTFEGVALPSLKVYKLVK